MKQMSVYSKESGSDLLFDKVDAIVIVDAEKDSYQTVKKQGLFEKLIENDGITYNYLEASSVDF